MRLVRNVDSQYPSLMFCFSEPGQGLGTCAFCKSPPIQVSWILRSRLSVRLILSHFPEVFVPTLFSFLEQFQGESVQPFTSMEDKISPVSEYSHPPSYVFGKGEKKSKGEKCKAKEAQQECGCHWGHYGVPLEFHCAWWSFIACLSCVCLTVESGG